MAVEGSGRVVAVALTASVVLALSKFTAAAWTGSSAMLAEAIHSLVAAASQALLVVGLARARRPADALHPFGYAKELNFWSFVVAILLFSLGAGVALYEGIGRLIDPRPIVDPHVNYSVLVVAFVLAGLCAAQARQAADTQRGTAATRVPLRAMKDPALLTVTLQSYAALAGLTIAALGLALSRATGSTTPDAYAAIAVGLLLGVVAAIMSVEIRSLIVGEAASAAVLHDVRAAIAAERGVGRPVRAINEIRTMQLGPTDVLVAASVDFEDGETAAAIEAATSRIEQAVKARHPSVRRFFMEGQSARDHAAAEAVSSRGAPPSEGNEARDAPKAADDTRAATARALPSDDRETGDTRTTSDLISATANAPAPGNAGSGSTSGRVGAQPGPANAPAAPSPHSAPAPTSAPDPSPMTTTGPSPALPPPRAAAASPPASASPTAPGATPPASPAAHAAPLSRKARKRNKGKRL